MNLFPFPRKCAVYKKVLYWWNICQNGDSATEVLRTFRVLKNIRRDARIMFSSNMFIWNFLKRGCFRHLKNLKITLVPNYICWNTQLGYGADCVKLTIKSCQPYIQHFRDQLKLSKKDKKDLFFYVFQFLAFFPYVLQYPNVEIY